ILRTYLTWDDVARYIQEFSKKFSFLLFIKLLLKKDYKQLDKKMDITEMVEKTDIKYSDIISELTEVNEENKNQIYNEVFKKLTGNRSLIEESIVRWFDVIDEFTLKFNVNSKEQTTTNGALMKDITEMSLGQKVVAILSFVFNYGYYIGDNTPLVIDQPEDNLDNQYIYKNLVESLKQIKNNRQVIIVTHNSTIVTNSDTEQVIVMESNNNKGWVENKGYPSDQKIAKLIINCLEGGIDSFKHKMATYTLFVDELKK
ncbi:AAA family ATPase, partial [Peribacillus sp. NPDC056705]|uniref:AAA family ATPase n=1 Tax=Peribacillus sp. NPDC056705 TaxID=3345918 RepID=UPI00374A5110